VNESAELAFGVVGGQESTGGKFEGPRSKSLDSAVNTTVVLINLFSHLRTILDILLTEIVGIYMMVVHPLLQDAGLHVGDLAAEDSFVQLFEHRDIAQLAFGRDVSAGFTLAVFEAHLVEGFEIAFGIHI